MTNLNLDRDEAIVLESEEVLRLKQDGDYDELDNVVLTNKKLYGSYKKGLGLFKKSNTELYAWPLSDIKIINGQAQAQQIMYAGELCLRIQFINEPVYLAFSDDPEETMLQWILEINKLLGTTGIIPPPKPPKEKKRLFARKRTEPADSKKNVTSIADDPAPKPSAEKVHTAMADHSDDPQPVFQPQQPKTTRIPKDKYCTNCGNKLETGTIFCPICGFKVTSTKDSATVTLTPPAPSAPSTKGKVSCDVKPEKVEEKHDFDANEKLSSTYTQREQEFAGKIIKCPSCGEAIPSFIAICPACGHEINSAKVVESLARFISQIEECDKRIANSPETPKKGWATWKLGKRIGWVMLNFFFAFIPMIIYFLRPFFRTDKAPALTKEEKIKATIIENFAFPNERESILEALLYIKSKIAFLATEKVNANNAYWARLWFKKAEGLYQKAIR